VSEVACGSNFNVVTVRKSTKPIKDDTDSENELEEEIFINSCPQCLNNVMLSPGSVTSSDTCLTGLHAQQFSEDRSTNSISALSTASKEHISLPEMDKKELSGIIENGGECPNNLTDSEKDEKRNVIFINTETARQFLTRQLSWVSSYGHPSAKEDIPMENVDRSTRLIKQNVSNMANLVYEGVKNVGGKVVTLSRHMSGSSDINEGKADSNENLEEQGDSYTKPTASSLALSLRCEEFPWSSSTGSSEHELSQQGLNERINTLSRTGSNILATELWTWGDVQYGQLGTGDIIKRPRPVLVAKLSHIGIRKISCGAFHVLALTLDGRVFAWGRNNFKQVTLHTTVDQSAPQLFTTKLSSNERAIDMAAGDFHSLMMMHHGLYFMGQSR